MLGKANPLTKERYTKLQSIGFVWTIRRNSSGKGKQITNTKKPMCNNNNSCLQKLELTGELKFICSQKDDHHDDDHHDDDHRNDNIMVNHQHNDSVNIYELHNQLRCHINSSTSINDDKSPCIRVSKKDFAATNNLNHHHLYNDVDGGVKNNIPSDNDDTTSGATPLTTHDYDTKSNNKNKSKQFTVEATSTTKFNSQSNCNSRAEDVVDNPYQQHHDISHHQESTSDSSGFDPIFWANE